MGFGDVRLAAVLGLYLGWINLLLPMIGLFIACIIGVVLGVGVPNGRPGRVEVLPVRSRPRARGHGGDLVLGARSSGYVGASRGRLPEPVRSLRAVVVAAGTVVAGGRVVVVATGNIGRIAASTWSTTIRCSRW